MFLTFSLDYNDSSEIKPVTREFALVITVKGKDGTDVITEKGKDGTEKK